MELYKGLLFHNRYLLVNSLGQGASAEVWQARDTKANNLKVALKIYSQHSEMDSYGLQNFEREFTTVFNMKHTNLLPPTGYDICNGRPYLIMQFCENGSCSSMIGRVEEDDVIKFLHDVSAGLEYLHDHNIIHQDIKPDNILLDDNCNFMVTDFGISVNSNNDINGANGMSGGTRAYMGPERFEGITNSASDMWSLGATVVELLTGNPPYGEHGGLLQAEGEPLPELPELQPEVKDMIMRCLAKDPNKRIMANEIRQKIELYWETGSWVKHSPRQTIIMVATGVVCVLMCLGIYFWDYNRTKVYYYKDYAEYWDVPEGIGRLSNNDVKHRQMSYRFEYKQRKLRRLSLVNSAGKIISHSETEYASTRFSDAYYFYADNGKIDYKTIYDQNGCLLYKMDYDENLKTVTFRQNDEYGTEMNLDASVKDLYNVSSSITYQKSRISRYLLTYDEDGLLIERRFVGLQNVPACDKNKIYGQKYKHDDKGRLIEEQYIGADGNITSNKDGLSIKVFAYNDNDDWTAITYLNAERQGSHDGNNNSIMKLEYDKYGNRIKETYYTIDEAPSLRSDMSISGFSYSYNDKGFEVERTCLGIDGKPAYCNAGYVTVRNTYNDNGFSTRVELLDENGNAVLCGEYSSITIEPNETDLPLTISYFDEFNNPMEDRHGVFRSNFTYDKFGNPIKVQYFNKEDNPTAYDGFNYARVMEYDIYNRMTRDYGMDDKGSITTTDGVIAEYRVEYNRQGAITKVSYYDPTGNLVAGNDMSAGTTIEYDELGNVKYVQTFDVKEEPCMTTYGYSKTEYIYDPETNFCVEIKEYDTKGKVISDTHYKFDVKGNIVEQYSLMNGKLEKGTAVTKNEYDINNRETTRYYCNLDGNKINSPGESYSQIKYEYDVRGNMIEMTFWGTDGKPAVDEYKTHKRIREYDMMNRIICERDFDINDKPVSGKYAYPETKFKYDKWGNQTETSYYDGYGKPTLVIDGYFMYREQYNIRGQVIKEEYIGIDGELVNNKTKEYAKRVYTYNNHGKVLVDSIFDSSTCIKINLYKYNDKNKLIELMFCDGNGKLLSSDQYIWSRYTIDYDKNGIVPQTIKFYNRAGTLMATQKWDEKNAEWGDFNVTNQAKTMFWQNRVRDDANSCPQKIDDGFYIQSITYSSSSVTITFKYSEISIYEIGDINDMDLDYSSIREIKDSCRERWSLPSNVSINIIFVDKASRKIASY